MTKKVGPQSRQSEWKSVWGWESTRDALFIICEEWLYGRRMGRQGAVQRIESMKDMFGTACLQGGGSGSGGKRGR